MTQALNLIEKSSQFRPLADKLRPSSWEDFVGLESLDRYLVNSLKSGQGKPPSLIFWGPPGSGKTTIAKLIGKTFNCDFIEISAVLAGVQEVRAVVAEAKKKSIQTVLFVDEIHRFNKAQQDAFLPHVEAGTITLLGATTENPSFYLNQALLSRARVVVLKSLSEKNLLNLAKRAAQSLDAKFSETALQELAKFCSGDARKLANVIEAFVLSHEVTHEEFSAESVQNYLKDAHDFFYDRDGEEHYNQISAFIKSLRGSDPDAALYWGLRILEGGEDPRFLIRRMMIFASEDIGNADPRGLEIAVATAGAFERLGMPEGRIPIAHCITYLASAPKSNRSYLAMHAALDAVKKHSKILVPKHLRNAPTKLMKDLDYGAGYQYPHDFAGGHVKGVQYLPDELQGEKFYEPSERGYEQVIKERLAKLKI